MNSVEVYPSNFAPNAKPVPNWKPPVKHRRQWTKFQQKKWLKRELRKAWNAGKVR